MPVSITIGSTVLHSPKRPAWVAADARGLAVLRETDSLLRSGRQQGTPRAAESYTAIVAMTPETLGLSEHWHASPAELRTDRGALAMTVSSVDYGEGDRITLRMQ